MNRALEARPANPHGQLPNALFWLERGYPSTLIFDAYGNDAEKTRRRDAVSADGTQEIRAVDILEEVIPTTHRSFAMPQVALRDPTQEVDAIDVLDEEPVQIAPNMQVPPPPKPALSAAIYTPALAPTIAPVVLATAVPEHVQSSEPVVLVASVDPSTVSSSELPRVTTLAASATGDWQQRRRFGHWLAGGSLLAASAIVLFATAVHAFAGEMGESSVRSPRSEDGTRHGRTTLLLTAHPAVAPSAPAAAQPPIPTVSIDTLPPARRGRR
jgi:hypothetical protein